MIDPDLRQRARANCPVCDGKGVIIRTGGIDENDVGFTYDKPKRFPCRECKRVEAALRAVQQETEQRMNVQRALAWDETAKRIEEIDTLTEERDACLKEIERFKIERGELLRQLFIKEAAIESLRRSSLRGPQ